MSEIVEQELQPPAPETPPETPPPVVAQDDDPEAVEVRPGEHMVPVGVVKALRAELKNVKPLAEKAAQLETKLAGIEPFVNFLQQNPHLLQQQPPQPPPAPAVQPQDDPELIEIARTLELYNAQTGQPDTARAAKIRDFNARTAQAIAQQAIAPVQQATDEQRAAANVQRIMSRTVAGKQIGQEHVTAAIKTIAAGVPKTEFMRIMADPTVANVIETMALGLQAAAQAGQPPPVPAPTTPPLQVESAGGGQPEYQISDLGKRFAKERGLTEKQYVDTAKRYVPGRPNSLE